MRNMRLKAALGMAGGVGDDCSLLRGWVRRLRPILRRLQTK